MSETAEPASGNEKSFPAADLAFCRPQPTANKCAASYFNFDAVAFLQIFDPGRCRIGCTRGEIMRTVFRIVRAGAETAAIENAALGLLFAMVIVTAMNAFAHG